MRYGHVEKFTIVHRYAGPHAVIGRRQRDSDSRVEGRLDCGDFSLDLGYRGRIFDREGLATALGFYLVKGDLVGRALDCEIQLTELGLEGSETIQIYQRGSAP